MKQEGGVLQGNFVTYTKVGQTDSVQLDVSVIHDMSKKAQLMISVAMVKWFDVFTIRVDHLFLIDM